MPKFNQTIRDYSHSSCVSLHARLEMACMKLEVTSKKIIKVSLLPLRYTDYYAALQLFWPRSF